MRFTKKAEESEIDRDVRRSWTAFLKDCYEADLEVITQKIILIFISLYRKNSELKNNFEDSYKQKFFLRKFSKVSHFIKIIEDYFFLFSLLFIFILFFLTYLLFLLFVVKWLCVKRRLHCCLERWKFDWCKLLVSWHLTWFDSIMIKFTLL